MSSKAFALRMKISAVDRVQTLILEGEIAIGWSHAKNLLGGKPDREHIKSILRNVGYKDATNGSAHMLRFLHEMEVGSIVVVPHKSDIYFARVESEPFYRDEKRSEDTSYRRRVQVLNGGDPVDRHALPAEIQKALRFRRTSEDLTEHYAALTNCVKADEFDYHEAATGLDERATEARETQLRLTTTRPEQANFRMRLIAAYEAKCCVSRTNFEVVLQAAHIVPHKDGGPGVNAMENGLLLRSDIHLLFDALHISIEPETMTLVVSDTVKMSGEYADLQGKRIHAPLANRERLAIHYERFRAKLA